MKFLDAMKTYRGDLRITVVSVLLLGVVNSVCAQKTTTKETEATDTVVPQSVFIIPANPKEGRDPFYPNSTRAPGSVAPEKPVTSTAVAALVFNGISGGPGHWLAIINGKTLAEGETSEIPTKSGPVKVHCLTIKSRSVVVEVGGKEQELRLRGE